MTKTKVHEPKNKNVTLREKVMTIIEDKNLTDYYVAKETGLALYAIQHMRSGKGNPDRILLGSAEKYEKLYDKLYTKNGE